MTDNIIGKVIVITGASSGMGEAAARYLAEKGAKVVMAARRIDRIEAIASELQKQNKEAIAVATDVTKLDDVNNLIETAVNKFGRVDVLINNAGLMPLSRLE
jgi:NADP-dependent 3-hydroxy acid dehydrogenase YdfG